MPLGFLNFNNLVFTVSDVLIQQNYQEPISAKHFKDKNWRIFESANDYQNAKNCSANNCMCCWHYLLTCILRRYCTLLHHSCPLLYFSPPELPPSPCLPFIFGITTPALHSLQMSSFSVDLTSSCTGWVLQWEKISLHHLVR